MAKTARMTGEQIGRNVTVTREGDTLVFRVNANADGTTSASGKSSVIATTNGNVGIPGTDLKIGLNIYRPV